MVKKLNNTNAIVERPRNAGENHSISTRKVDNGYVVSESSYNPKTMEYRNSESFQQSPPKIIPGRVDSSPSPDSGGGLRDTMSYLADGE